MKLMSGNEAIAQGAWEAGATVGVAYPGTPSTETLESFAAKEGVYAEWCVNEKVAMEVGAGASAAGARVLATMKHVGVNVAADPLFTLAYTGVNGGFVLLAADDPGMYSSQNEQDSRYYALAAHILCLDPADSEEAYRFAREAYELSERFDVPVMLRSTVRISHTKTLVDPADVREVFEPSTYEKDPSKWVMMPAFAKGRRTVQLERIASMEDWVETCPYNETFDGCNEIGIICSGAVYQHVREAVPDASVLKLGVTYPLPRKRLSAFADSVEKCYVVEEGSTYLREMVQANGIALEELPHPLTREGEIDPLKIRVALGLEEAPSIEAYPGLPARPPALCAGCPHRVVFKELSRMWAVVTGDIGCYTLGGLPPLSALDSVVDMGASVSMAHGFELALEGMDHRPIVGIIGDSTFAHSGLSSLLSTQYNAGSGTICILDNRTTAMTGRQGNPFNGVTLQNRPSYEIDMEAIVRGCGIEDVQVVDPYDVKAVRSALQEATQRSDSLSVLIFKAPCVLLERNYEAPYIVNAKCTGCGVCATIGCPAIRRNATSGCSSIDTEMCIGCGQCAQYCNFGAIESTK